MLGTLTINAPNRLHDSIAIFSIGETGELTFVEEAWTRGNYPRSFSFNPTGHYTPVGNPSAIVFLDLETAK